MCTLVVVVDKEVVEGVKFEFDDDIVTIVVDNFVWLEFVAYRLLLLHLVNEVELTVLLLEIIELDAELVTIIGVDPRLSPRKK